MVAGVRQAAPNQCAQLLRALFFVVVVDGERLFTERDGCLDFKVLGKLLQAVDHVATHNHHRNDLVIFVGQRECEGVVDRYRHIARQVIDLGDPPDRAVLQRADKGAKFEEIIWLRRLLTWINANQVEAGFAVELQASLVVGNGKCNLLLHHRIGEDLLKKRCRSLGVFFRYCGVKRVCII
ncbi:MAG: hypothetical protein EBY45_02310 [Gammaproteobacteria bacterium]|nr:hypothetical protein [Gammaproteobacteria bacterium]